MKCIRYGCNKNAIIDPTYGVVPCATCQRKDTQIKTGRRAEFSSVGKSHRVQKIRDKFGKDLLQPYNGRRVNPDFFKVYPEQVDSYGVRQELTKL